MTSGDCGACDTVMALEVKAAAGEGAGEDNNPVATAAASGPASEVAGDGVVMPAAAVGSAAGAVAATDGAARGAAAAEDVDGEGAG